MQNGNGDFSLCRRLFFLLLCIRVEPGNINHQRVNGQKLKGGHIKKVSCIYKRYVKIML